MTVAQNSEYQLARRVLETFSLYGFKKTSMADIATASGVSRQSVYKKFGSKQDCYSWVINTYLNDIYSRAFACLEQAQGTPEQTLVQVFDILIGDSIDIINRTHGTELLDDVLAAARVSDDDWLMRFRARLADFLARQQLVPADKSYGIAFVLMSAGKGLLLQGNTRQQLQQDIKLIIDSVKH